MIITKKVQKKLWSDVQQSLKVATFLIILNLNSILMQTLKLL